MKRHRDALFIQVGACNPSGIIHSMLDACNEIRQTPGHRGTAEITSDPALRLMIHQLAFICGVPTSETMADWQEWNEACRAEVPEGERPRL